MSNPNKLSDRIGELIAIFVIALIATIAILALFMVYLYRFAGYDPTWETIFSQGNILKTIALLVVVYGIAFSRMRKK